jgi:hypothetical protein
MQIKGPVSGGGGPLCLLWGLIINMKKTAQFIFLGNWKPNYFGCLVLLLALLSGVKAQAQTAPPWQLAMAVSPIITSFSEYSAMTTDASGNVYLAGTFSGSVGFGGTTLTSSGSDDIFVAKWSSATSRYVWAQQAGGGGVDYVRAIAVNGNSVYVTGGYGQPAIDFGSTSLPNAGGTDVFVAKLTDAGASASWTWAQRAGGTGSDGSGTLAVRGAEVYLSGAFASPVASFGSLSLTNTSSAAPPNATTDAFVAKLIDAGASASWAWAQAAGGIGNDGATAVALNGTSVYLTGFFYRSAAFGSLSLATGLLDSNLFVAKLTEAAANASFTWAETTSGTGGNISGPLVVSGSSLYIAGSIVGTASFGSTTLTSAGSRDIFVARLTDAGGSGSWSWAQRAGGADYDHAAALVINGSNLYVGGYFIGTTGIGGTTLASAGMTDIFLAKLVDTGASGSFGWAQRAGGIGNDELVQLAVDGTRLYAEGRISPPASFGGFTIPNTGTFRSTFLASLSDTGASAAASAAPPSGLACRPNPARGTATIDLPALPGATLTLTDALGRTLRTQLLRPNSTTAELDLTGLAPGLYQVRVQAGGQQLRQRLVVE